MFIHDSSCFKARLTLLSRLQNDGQTKSELYAIYCQRLHCQPLPLFDKNQLRHALDTCPKHLFSALYLATCRYSSRPHYPYHHSKGLIKTLWNVVASTDTKGLDVVQVYCVLALTFIWSMLIVLFDVAKADSHQLAIALLHRSAPALQPLFLMRSLPRAQEGPRIKKEKMMSSALAKASSY